MEDIRSILTKIPAKLKSESKDQLQFQSNELPTSSEIPDVFFDEVLIYFKLNRQEINVLMYLYRYIWCKPNLYRSHGIGPIHSYQEMARHLHLSQEETIQVIRHLESLGLIQTVRAGQYFVRKYFTEQLDQRFNHIYDF
jgi:hypothetical protein